MLKQYIKRLILKEWLPVISVFALVSLALVLTYASIIDFYPQSPYYDDSFSKPIFDFVYLSIPISLFAIVLPFFVYSYRFKTQSCDTYYQLPFAPKKLKNTRLLTGLVTILAIYSFVFLILFAFVTIKYYSSPEIKQIYTTYYDQSVGRYVYGAVNFTRFEFQPLMLLVTYVIGLFGIAGLYFETCFFISLTNSTMSAVILNISAQVFLTLFITNTAVLLVDGMSFEYQSFILISPGLIGVNGMAQTFAYSFVLEPNLYDFNIVIFNNEFAIAYIFYAINALIFAGFGVFVLLEKDPSGENAGRPATRNIKLDYIIYVAMLTEIVFVTRSNSYSDLYIGLIAGIVYFGYRYLVASLFFQTPKLAFNHYIIMGSGAILMAVGLLIS